MITNSAQWSDCMQCAVENDDAGTVETLMQNKHVDFKSANIFLDTASYWDCKKVVKQLLKIKEIDPTIDNNSPLRHAAHRGHFEIVKALVKDDRVEIKASDTYLFERYEGHRFAYERICRLLLQNVIMQTSENIQTAFQNAIGNALTSWAIDLYKQFKLDPVFKVELNDWLTVAKRESLFDLCAKTNRVDVLKQIVRDKRVLDKSTLQDCWLLQPGKKKYLIFTTLAWARFVGLITNKQVLRKNVDYYQYEACQTTAVSLSIGLAPLQLPSLLLCFLTSALTEPMSHCVDWRIVWNTLNLCRSAVKQ